MVRFSLILLLLSACTRRPDCCETADCSDAGTQLAGTEVLQFRGSVPSNLLFISIDTLRRDHVGIHDPTGRPSLTPFLDQLAADGVVMQDHLQCSNWTYGSMTCTLAGRTNPQRGHIPRFQKHPVPNGTAFLPSWLADAGFSTALFSTNDYFSAERRNTQGFEREKVDLDASADEALRAGMAQIRPSGRWFQQVHVREPHLPYEPTDAHWQPSADLEPWPDRLHGKGQGYWLDRWDDLDADERALLEAHTRELYAGEVRTLDARLARAWDELDASCALDDTLVVLWTDHGEGFWEHGSFSHSHKLTAEESDGVLIFWAKNLVPGTWEQTTASIDLVPTLLDLYDLPIPPEVTGLPIGTAPPDRPIFAESFTYEGPLQSVVQSGFKLQYHWNSGFLRLWNRNEDRDESQLIVDPEHRMMAPLWEALQPELSRMEAAIDVSPVPPQGLER